MPPTSCGVGTPPPLPSLSEELVALAALPSLVTVGAPPKITDDSVDDDSEDDVEDDSEDVVDDNDDESSEDEKDVLREELADKVVEMLDKIAVVDSEGDTEVVAPEGDEVAAEGEDVSPVGEDVSPPVGEEVASPVGEEVVSPVGEEVAPPVGEEVAPDGDEVADSLELSVPTVAAPTGTSELLEDVDDVDGLAEELELMPNGRGVAPGVMLLVAEGDELGVCGVARDEAPGVLAAVCCEDSELDDEVTGGVDPELKGYDGTAGTVRSLGKAGTDGTCGKLVVVDKIDEEEDEDEDVVGVEMACPAELAATTELIVFTPTVFPS